MFRKFEIDLVVFFQRNFHRNSDKLFTLEQPLEIEITKITQIDLLKIFHLNLGEIPLCQSAVCSYKCGYK